MQAETPLVFACQGQELVGILHAARADAELGVIIVVAGGPQYRIGVNRQFVMMGRMFAGAGIPTLRFDHRGIGDSAGDYRGFVDMSDDIRSAVDALQKAVPSVKKVALWGECESATAISFYAHQDPRVSGIFMVNPWIRTEEGQAKTYLKHYYIKRILNKQFWNKVRSGKFNVFASIRSFGNLIRRTFLSGRGKQKAVAGKPQSYSKLPLPERLQTTTSLYDGCIYIVTSGKDYIAMEFKDYMKGSPEWKSILASDQVQFVDMVDADHTFSRIEWRDELFDLTFAWLKAN